MIDQYNIKWEEFKCYDVTIKKNYVRFTFNVLYFFCQKKETLNIGLWILC